MKPFLHLLMGGLFFILATGCSPLGSLKPLGANPVVLKPEEINGTWACNGGSLQILVTDATNGAALAAWIEESNGDMTLKKVKLIVRQTGETTFVNVRSLEKPDEFYVVGRGKASEDTLIFWPGETEALKQAVKLGRFSIVATNDFDAVVSTNFQQAAEFLASPEGKAMFDLEEPIVLTRMPR